LDSRTLHHVRHGANATQLFATTGAAWAAVFE
jgi:hypothetical protein